MDKCELARRRTVWLHVRASRGDGGNSKDGLGAEIRVIFGDAIAAFVTTIDLKGGNNEKGGDENLGLMCTREIDIGDNSDDDDGFGLLHRATYSCISWQIVCSSIECATSNSIGIVDGDERVQLFLRVLDRELSENERE